MEDIVVDLVVVDFDRYYTVLICGEIDCCTGPNLASRLLELAETADRPIIMDMSGIAFLDGAALRILAQLQSRCTERGIPVAVVGLRNFLTELFRAVGLHESLPLCTTHEEALWCLFPLPDQALESWLNP